MPIGRKHDFEPILAPGRHVMNLPVVKQRFVDDFPDNSRRAILYQKLEELIQRLLVAGICCHVWLDGSFLTKKGDPDDIDASIMLDPDVSETLTTDQQALLDAIEDVGESPRVDSFVFVWRRKDDPLFGDDSADPASGWHEVYGLEHSKRWLKGFVVIKLGETGVGLRICS